MGQLSDFLSSTKQKFLEDLKSNKADDWTVVMGNEAGDLDSIASSLAYSYLASTLRNKPTVALVQTPRTDLYLRSENLYAFDLASLDPNNQDLLCIDDIPEAHPISSCSQFALVDHNKLLPTFRGKGKVVGIIDHHTDEGDHLDAEIREIVPTGSCASLVTRQFKPNWESATTDVSQDVATLLISAIYIDTGGLKPGDKAVDIDNDAVAFLTSRSSFSATRLTATSVSGTPIPPLDTLSKELSSRKKSVSHLSSRDLLRRDYKEYTFGKLPVGLSTVPYGLGSWLEKDADFWKSLESWMEERKLSVLGVLTTFSSEKKKEHRREVVALLRGEGVDKEMEKQIFKQLGKSKDLKLEEKAQVKVGKGRRAKAWNQKNVKATRKLFAPLLKGIIEGGGEAAPKTKAGKHKRLGSLLKGKGSEQSTPQIPAEEKAKK